MSPQRIQQSSKFRQQTIRAISAIALFILFYMAVVGLSIGLALLCLYLGGMLILTLHFITILLGVGVISLGIFVLIFLLKFLFKSRKVDRNGLVEVFEKDEPELFRMLHELVDEVGTGFPKKVYVSADVNAAVFYDSSFWSMFFPVKKNLIIGIGLVNTVTEQELKAILAHEFGHFSQRTMKVGSYVYNVNQVIHNMLFDNEGYDKMVRGWAGIHGAFALAASLAVHLTNGIKWMLVKMYSLVNITHQGLSREMEFHADEIAARISGTQPLKHSLLRMELAEHAFNSVLGFYQKRIPGNMLGVSRNVYAEQAWVMKFLAEENKMNFQNGLPLVSVEELNKYNKSKLIITDQWASHPSTEERIRRMEALNLAQPEGNSRPATALFQHIDTLQQQLTQKMFSNVAAAEATSGKSLEEFQYEFRMDFTNNSFHPVFKGYYDNKNITAFNPDHEVPEPAAGGLDELFSSVYIDKIHVLNSMESDWELLKRITTGEFQVKTFDYDGWRYKRSEASDLVVKIGKELATLKAQLAQHDVVIFRHFLFLEKQSGAAPELLALYKKWFSLEKEIEEQMKYSSELFSKLEFTHVETPFGVIEYNFRVIREEYEPKLRENIRNLLNDKVLREEVSSGMLQNFERYLEERLTYFYRNNYVEANLQFFNRLINDYCWLLSRKFFIAKRELLNYQAALVTEGA